MAAKETLFIIGFIKLLVNAFGPLSVYDVAPLVVKFNEEPAQTGELDKSTGVGVETTVTLAIAVLIHPLTLLPVKV